MRQNLPYIHGVGLVITCQSTDGELVLMLEELTTKRELGKLAGMHSFPMETRNVGESLSSTVRRLIREELPGLGKKLRVHLRPPIGRYQVVPGTWLQAYHASCLHPLLPIGRPDPDVDNHYWMPLIEAATYSNLRQGAREPLWDHLSRLQEVVREECERPAALDDAALPVRQTA